MYQLYTAVGAAAVMGITTRSVRRRALNPDDERILREEQNRYLVHVGAIILPGAAEPLSDILTEAIDLDPFGEDDGPETGPKCVSAEHKSSSPDDIRTLEDLLEACEINEEDWAIRKCVLNHYAGNWQVKAELIPAKIASLCSPDPFVVSQTVPRIHRSMSRSTETAVIIPDSQHGFIWSEDYTKLIPLHDPVAWDVVVQIVRAADPDYVVFLGDMLDLAEMSVKYERDPRFENTTNLVARAFNHDCRSIREAAPHAEIVYLEGNHEKRLKSYMLNRAPRTVNLKKGGVGDNLISIPNILDLGAYDIQYIDEYGEELYLWDLIKCTHGTVVGSKSGDTAKKVIADAEVTTFFGHIHRIEMATRTRHRVDGDVTIGAYSPGCLCRLDNIVPGTPGKKNWQQGVSVIEFDGLDYWVEMMEIKKGRTRFRGAEYQGTDYWKEYSEVLGVSIAPLKRQSKTLRLGVHAF